MEIIFSKIFNKEFKKIKDSATRKRIIVHIKKLAEMPLSGKPLQYELKGYRTIRIQSYRIIYRIENESIVINCFDHRKNVYD